MRATPRIDALYARHCAEAQSISVFIAGGPTKLGKTALRQIEELLESARDLERELAEAVELLEAGERVFRKPPSPKDEMSWLSLARAFLQRMEGK